MVCVTVSPVGPVSPVSRESPVLKTFSKLLTVTDLTHFWLDLSEIIHIGHHVQLHVGHHNVVLTLCEDSETLLE